MKIRSSEVPALCMMLFESSLRGKDSRMRTKMVELLSNYVNEYESERISLVKENALKNEDGTIVMIKDEHGEDTNDVKIEPSREEEFHREFMKLVNGHCIIDEIESNEEMIRSVAETILNSPVEYKGEQAVIYDGWCEIFEKAVSNYDKSE